jgi:hypothetical protein
MRKFLVLPMAGIMLLAGAAPVAAGANASNTSGSGRTIQGEWYDGTTYGFVILLEESSGEYGELYEESGEWVLCTPGASPEEEVYGFVGTRTFGWSSEIDMSLASKLSSGTATAAFEVGIETVDDCTGASEVEFELITIAIDVVADGSLVTFRNAGSFQVPGEFNAHARYRGRERQAAGSIDLGPLGSRTLGYAVMAEYSWSEHANG